MNKALQQALLRCNSLQSLPGIYQKITQKMEQSSTTHNELAELVKLDPAVSGKLLAIVNSAFFGFPRQISTISHAISIIGLAEFKNLVLSTSIIQLFEQSKHNEFSMESYWEHSLLVALISKSLGQYWQVDEDLETFFIAGLLHDVGKLLMVQACPDQVSRLNQLWGEHADLAQEEALLGFDHAAAGEALIQSWKLPEILLQAIAAHHQIDKALPPCGAAVAFANLIANNDESKMMDYLQICSLSQKNELSMEDLIEIRQQAVEVKSSLISIYLGG